MSIRERLIKEMDSPHKYQGLYDEMKSCLILRAGFDRSEVMSKVDMWFHGAIESLHYKPNKYLLLLEGRLFGKEIFLSNLAPKEWGDLYSSSTATMSIYENFIVNYEINYRTTYKKVQHEVSSDCFQIITSERGFPLPEKRLASITGVRNEWFYPESKRTIVVPIEDIDLDRFNKINKMDLWKEIFQLHKKW